MLTKEKLRLEFTKDWEKHYKIDFLIDQGFIRKVCPKCGRGYWTLDEDREHCPDQPCQFYEFLDNPPTSKRFDYVQTWKVIEDFFRKHDHASIRRYPIVCRWRPDLFFTIASIIDFQRLEKNEVIFQFPENPLIVPQFCLRFNDIPNVGVTGRHYSCFCMIGQHSLFDGHQGYWKDRCIELDFKLLSGPFGIKPEEIVFLENLWVGPGALGPSLEYFVRGLEIGNAVFTQFKSINSNITEMKEKIIDMGAGLERFAWITQGTPTSYDVTFEPILRYLKKQTGIKYDAEFFLRYSKLAGSLNLDEVKNIRKMREQIANQLGVTLDLLDQKIKPLEALYAISDHTMGLTFAIADGLLPSNVGGGYNLRVILRRALSFIDEFRWNIDLIDVCELHARHLKLICPELSENLNEIQKILEIEKKRFHETKLRTKRIVEAIIQKGEKIDEERLIKLYDSEGITPELVQDYIQDLKIPVDFYVKVTEKHMRESKITIQEPIDVSGLPPTELLVYDDPKKTEFQAKVLRMIDDKWVVLDKTYFYATSGGQLSDVGFIEDFPVSDVQKVGDVVVHRILGKLKEGQVVNCNINNYRRESLTKNHDAVHIVLASAREVIGQWVWQAGSEVTTDKARLDITHFESLTDEQIEKIEEKANEIIKKNLPIKIEVLPRNEAEKKYGFRIYQGGTVPEGRLRIVSIGNIDHECCGGTHGNSTRDVGFIIILKTKRIQDGVNRIEFSTGDVALKYLREKERILTETARLLKVTEEKVPEAVKELFETWKTRRKELRKLKKK
ncbi:MAG: alanine--tRNA ligase [Candidatus Aenigmarchaeota archaeon]|nr:alanine--tRNA ligase [Candidatus Aenigmarchaeota archaeon]